MRVDELLLVPRFHFETHHVECRHVTPPFVIPSSTSNPLLRLQPSSLWALFYAAPTYQPGAPPPPRYLGQDTTGDAYARASEAPLATRWPPRLKRRCPCQAEIGQDQTYASTRSGRSCGRRARRGGRGWRARRGSRLRRRYAAPHRPVRHRSGDTSSMPASSSA